MSIIVPVYKEVATADAVQSRLTVSPYRYPEQQVIAVNDGSTDGTADTLAGWAGRPGLTLLRHTANRERGAAVRTGLVHATGAIAMVQDADLEYKPADLPRLVEPIERGECTAAYGSRYIAGGAGQPWTLFRLGVVAMNWLFRVMYGVRLTDVNTCYKALPTELYWQLDLRSERFEFCAEVTAKLVRRDCQILEVPISYRPRTRAEGKKIGWRDAVQFAGSLVAWRVFPAGVGLDSHA